MLYHIIKSESLQKLTFEQVLEFARFANHMAAYVTTKYGSAEIMPDYNKVMDLIKTTHHLENIMKPDKSYLKLTNN